MRVVEDVRYGSGEKDFLDIYYPDAEEYDVLVWIHGGGLESGTRKDACFAEDLMTEELAVVSVEYRMYPEAVFPEFITDCARAVKYVQEHIMTEAGAKRVFISGQSAGAYITMMLALDKHYLADAGVCREEIAGFISDSAQVTTHFNVLRERGLDTRLERIDEAAPLYFVSENSFTGNLLLIYYTNDMPCRPEQNHLLYKSMKRLCPEQNIEIVELPGPHCFGSTRRNERGTYDYCEELLEFIRKM